MKTYYVLVMGRRYIAIGERDKEYPEYINYKIFSPDNTVWYLYDSGSLTEATLDEHLKRLGID